MTGPELITTSDGSHSLFSPVFGETYHSKHGAIQESNHIFIRNGLQAILPKDQIHILELGFGTGLNALLSLVEAVNTDQKMFYTTYEKYPITETLYSCLNYVGKLDIDQQTFTDMFSKMHAAAWDVAIDIHPNFMFKKIQQDIAEIENVNQFDLVYFDAFAPATQPELWDEILLEKIYRAMKPGARLSTYCAQGAFRRHLKSVGFQVESAEGPPGKREITIAIK